MFHLIVYTVIYQNFHVVFCEYLWCLEIQTVMFFCNLVNACVF